MHQESIKPVTKAVIPAAGFGTRFLPQTKAMPKEMLPLVDKPIIQHIVEELIAAGIKDIIIVTGYHKRSIEDHFDSPSADLVQTLKAGGEKKKHILEEVERISNLANFYFARQKGPLGNITPLNNVKALIGNEPFIYVWADDFFDTEGFDNEFRQMINAYNLYDACVLSCVTAGSDDDYIKYGFVKGQRLDENAILVEDFIEKPGKNSAPSDLAAVSCQLYKPEILNYFEEAYKSKREGEEFMYTHLVNSYIKNGGKVVALKTKYKKYVDTGDKLAWLKAQVHFGVKDPKIGEEFRNFLHDFTKQNGIH